MEINEILEFLGEINGYDISNGNGYIKHDSSIEKIKLEIIKISLKEITNTSTFKSEMPILIEKVKSEIKNGIMPNVFFRKSIIARVINQKRSYNSIFSTLNQIWSRIACMDEFNREWDQQYFALNPNEGIQKCVNIAEVRNNKIEKLIYD